jgi:rubrerythrin
MKRPTESGLNRTGIDMSPEQAKALMQGVEEVPNITDGDERTLAAYRVRDLREADPIGSVPIPGTVKGFAKTGLQKLIGNQPEVLIDKLAGRLAFERTGTRLYDALLAKCSIRKDEATGLSLEQLLKFRNDEGRHFELLWDAMQELGADPTAQTPEADLNGTASMGWVQIVNDPRTSIAQCLHAIQMAELADHDGWELLIHVAREMGQTDMAEKFQTALLEEDQHLEAIRQVLQQTTLAEAGR